VREIGREDGLEVIAGGCVSWCVKNGACVCRAMLGRAVYAVDGGVLIGIMGREERV
jgi:hypothetical protein